MYWNAVQQVSLYNNSCRSAVKSDDFALGSQSDPNTFGTLSPSNPYLTSILEGTEEDQTEDKYISELPNYLPQKEYVDMIKKYLNQRRVCDHNISSCDYIHNSLLEYLFPCSKITVMKIMCLTTVPKQSQVSV